MGDAGTGLLSAASRFQSAVGLSVLLVVLVFVELNPVNKSLRLSRSLQQFRSSAPCNCTQQQAPIALGQGAAGDAAATPAVAAVTDSVAAPACPACAACPACPEQKPAAGTNSTATATAGSWPPPQGPLAALAAAPWKPALPDHELQKGLVSHGNMARTRRFLNKLLTGQPVTVVAIGGSVSWGHGASARGVTDFPAIIFNWLNATFPNPKHRFLNRAISATPSTYFTLCLQWHVPPEVDLVVMDFNTNDGSDRGDVPIRRAHERLIRKLLEQPKRPPVVEVVFFYWALDWLENAEIPYRHGGDDELGVLAQYYHLPWVSDRSLLWDTVYAKGNPKYKAEEPWPSFHIDRNHPNDVGHRYLAEMVIFYLRRVLEDLSFRPLGPADEAASLAPLPPPMLRNNWPNKKNSCLVGKLFNQHVISKTGFAWVNEGSREKPKWGWLATTVGATLRFKINTAMAVATARGNEEAGGMTTVGVLHLRSYEHMGVMQLSCVSGCKCVELKIDGHHEWKVSQEFHTAWPVSRAESCMMEARVLNETRSGEHKVRIGGVIVSEVAGTRELYDERIHVDFNGQDGVGEFEW